MKLTGVEIDGELYHVATSYVDNPCDECSLREHWLWRRGGFGKYTE